MSTSTLFSKRLPSVIEAAFLSAALVPARADTMHIAPKAAFADTSYETQRAPVYAINGEGIDEATGTHGVTAKNYMWMGKNTDNTGGANFAKWFVVDLGAVYALDRMKIWNFNMNNGASYASRGVKQIDIYVSASDSDFSGSPTFSDASTWTLFKEDHVVAPASGQASYAGDDPVSFGGASARWVGFWIDTLQTPDAEYGGLSEVRFWEKVDATVSTVSLSSASLGQDGSVLLSGTVRLADGATSADVEIGVGPADGTQDGAAWATTYTETGCGAGAFSFEVPAADLGTGIHYFALGIGGAWSGTVRIPIGVSGVRTEWTGEGDGSSWNNAVNWSCGVPTATSTAVFGDGVAGNLAVSVSGADAVAGKVLFETPRNVTVPSLSTLDLEIGANAATSTVTALTFAAGDTVSTGRVAVAGASRLSIGTLSGDASLLKTGPGALTIGNASTRSAGTTEIREGLFVFAASGQLGTKLVVGGGESPAVARANNNWDDNFNPFSRNGCATEILTNGVLDLATDGSRKAYQRGTAGPILVRAGGRLEMGNRSFAFASAGTTNLLIEGEVNYGPYASIALDCNTIAVSARAGRQVALDMPISSQQQMAGWATFAVADVPGVPVDLVVNGRLAYSWAPRDGFQKRGAGVARFTNANTYGGGSDDSAGWTRVHEGTLLVDNETGSGTGNSRVSVGSGAVLGGTGTIGGSTNVVAHWANPNPDGSKFVKVVATGSDAAQATIAPGTIDDETGAPVPGVLTVGGTHMSNPVSFGPRSTLRIVLDESGVSRLTVFGKVTISDSGTELDVGSTDGGVWSARPGVYTILSATEGIEGSFASVLHGRSRLVSGVTETVDGVEVVKSLALTVPSRAMVIVIK